MRAPHEKLAVLTLLYPVVVVAQIGLHYTAVRQIGDFHAAAHCQVGRAYFLVRGTEVGVTWNGRFISNYSHSIVEGGLEEMS